MNILSYIHIHRLPNPSGVGRVIDRMIRTHDDRYPDARHRMLVDGSLYDAIYLTLPEYWKKQSFIPHRHSTTKQQAMWIWSNKPKAEEFWDEVDVVYCPAESFVATEKAKLVCTIHDVAGFEPDLYPNSLGHWIHRFKWTQLFKRMASRADAVVTVSRFSASRITHFFPELKEKLHVIYNAPHDVFGTELNHDTRVEVERISGRQPFILVPGGLSLRKNATLILEALPILQREFPDLTILVAGSNEKRYVKELRKLGLSNMVLCGYVSDEVLNGLYQRAVVVWFPSRYEGFGMPVIEAMAAGAPVVSSKAASIPEVAENVALLCDMDVVSEHVEAIRSLVSSEALRAKCRQAGLDHSKRFTWENSADELEKLFQAI